MKNLIYLVLLFGVIVSTNTAFSFVDGTETRNVDNFTIVDVSGGIQVTLVSSSSTKVELETKNCDPDDVKTVVDGDRLIIKYKKSNWGSSKRKVYATVYYKVLKGLEASSGSSIKTDETIKAENMAIEASSGASINANVACKDLDVDISSGGSVRLKGDCDSQEIDISSGASYRAEELTSKMADVSASSGASARIWVTKEFEADVSSGGTVKYKGDPEKTNIDSGYSGSVKKI